MKVSNDKRTGEASFCIPRAAINALLDAQATTYEIGAYLTIARATDPTGCYSRASTSALNRATGANKKKLKAALARLMQIRAKREILEERDGVQVAHQQDLGPILWAREEWMTSFAGPIPDNPTHPTRYVVPNFGEDVFERVWFSSNIVGGYAQFAQPLKALRDLGDVAARMLLAVHAVLDMEGWGAARPIGPMSAPWRPFKLEFLASAPALTVLHSAKAQPVWRVESIDPRIDPSGQHLGSALQGLLSHGFIYEVVTVLNRDYLENSLDPRSTKSDPIIDPDAEPLYDLYASSPHGVPTDERGVAHHIIPIATELGTPLHNSKGELPHVYGLLTRKGQPIAVAGLLRPRFRVRNHLNAGVTESWNRIRQSNAACMNLVNQVRRALGLLAVDSSVPDEVVESGISSDHVDQVPINTYQSSTNKSQSLQREKRKRKAPAEESGFDLEKELRNAL